MRITIVDVAKKANVSVATVSRVMNGNYPVKASTKEAVLKAIKELKYIPNIQAREFTMQQSTIIGVIAPSINNMFFPEVINGIETHLKSTALSLVLSCTNNDKDEEIRSVNNFLSRNVAGIIIIDPNTDNIKSKYYDDIAKKVPIVFVNGYVKETTISNVCNDEFLGSKIALEYLFKNNHRDILFLRGKDSYSYDVKEEIYINSMENINLFKKENIINVGDGNSRKTVENTTTLMLDVLKENKATAIFASNDLMAVGALNACKKLNISVPDDMSIIGFDNIDLCKYVEPKLTTIDQNMFLLGANASILLLEKISSNNKYDKKVLLNNFLVERDTVTKKSS